MPTQSPLGFSWDPLALVPLLQDESVDRAAARFRQALPHAVWEAAKFEDSPYTFPEVQTLMDGVTVGGHTLADQRLVLGLADAAREMVATVTSGTFRLDKATSDGLHRRIATGQAIEAGHVRSEGQAHGGGTLRLGEAGFYDAPEPGAGGSHLRGVFAEGIDYLTTDVADPGLQALLYAPWAIRSQFYFDGNKRTARWMMNGHLMLHGLEPIGVPVARRQEWNAALVTLFARAEATDLLKILAGCQFSRIEEQSRNAGLTVTWRRRGTAEGNGMG